ncbi:MAG: hypothetical protein WCK35_28360, partial [Chloroflexota bacterium]
SNIQKSISTYADERAAASTQSITGSTSGGITGHSVLDLTINNTGILKAKINVLKQYAKRGIEIVNMNLTDVLAVGNFSDIQGIYLDDVAAPISAGKVSGDVTTPAAAKSFAVLSGKHWDGHPDKLLFGDNGIVALAFSAVLVNDAAP